MHGQSSSGKPHVGLAKRKDFMHNKISKKLKYCQIYFMLDRIVIVTVMSCQLLSWRKQSHGKILRGKMQCLLERRIYLDVKSDRGGFELTFIRLLGMNTCQY